MVGPNLPFGGLACGLVLGPLPSVYVVLTLTNTVDILRARNLP